MLSATRAFAANPAAARVPADAPAPATLQPYASYWYPDSVPDTPADPGVVRRGLKGWRPQDDPDLPYNKATVPLARRHTPPAPNRHARPGQGGISALVSFGPTARNPSQGARGPQAADFYALSNWAYIDELVFWGGSSGEGLILAPNAPVVDAAHRHGVRVLGNVFLPQLEHGGQRVWTEELVRRDASGRFPVAEKLIQVARAYGFDGWFLNGETQLADGAPKEPETARRFADFVHALRTGAPDLRITWYDAFDADGDVGWQGRLNEQNAMFFQRDGGRQADTLFVDFRWAGDERALSDSAAYARRLGRDPYELWAGVDVEANGWNRAVAWDRIAPEGGDHVVSYGLYRPEWTFHSLGGTGGGRTPEAFHARDDAFWSGGHTDPARPEGPGRWRPAARHVPDRTTVTALPFATTFNTGHGRAWYENGVPTADTPWNHLGLQDVLPGRRWAIHTEGARPAAGFDFGAAWRGGSSLLIEAADTAPATVELYQCELPLRAAATVDLTHRLEPGSPDVVLELAVATAEPAAGRAPVFHRVPVGTVRAGDGWTTSRIRLDAVPGRTVHTVAVRLTARAPGARLRLGALAVRDRDPRATPPGEPRGLRVAASRETGGGRAELRLTWRPGKGAGTRHHEVHQLLPGGGRRFLGGTCASALYVPDLVRSGGEAETRIEVRAVGALFTASRPAAARYRWT
ncbi:endo-beta-N-acetylglucosaminidase [Streptomyces sp. NPDC050504]|uniref:endo-beta-N-acetylglucosaminidase n=1 Tax=Streptomyces sp. NPDC050504 TaxID=3365618 RepID=UPI0037B17B68